MGIDLTANLCSVTCKSLANSTSKRLPWLRILPGFASIPNCLLAAYGINIAYPSLPSVCSFAKQAFSICTVNRRCPPGVLKEDSIPRRSIRRKVDRLTRRYSAASRAVSRCKRSSSSGCSFLFKAHQSRSKCASILPGELQEGTKERVKRLFQL